MRRLAITLFVLLAAASATTARADPPIRNGWLIYSNEQKLGFDLREYLAEEAPHLLPYGEVISHWSGYWGINPKVALSLMELRTGLVTRGAIDPYTRSSPLGEWSGIEGFSEQLEKALGDLARRYYAERSSTLATSSDRRRHRAAGWTALESELGREAWDLVDTYGVLFPEDRLSRDVGPAIEPLRAGPPAWLRLPYLTGESWRFNGTHTTNGKDGGGLPFASIDFSRDWPRWGADTRDDWVGSALDGRVIKYSSCSLEVIGDQGWSMHYYHLDNIRVRSGQFVARNEKLANYAGEEGRALCNGGHSTGPHVHLTFRKRGESVSLNGVNLSRYRIHAGRFSYDRDCDHFWIGRGGSQWCAFSSLPNDGGVVFQDGFADGDTSGWKRFSGDVEIVAPGLKGTPYALEVPVSGTAGRLYVQASLGKARKSVAASFLVHANGVDLADGEVQVLTLGKARDNLRVTLAQGGGTYRVHLHARTASGGFLEIGSTRVPAARAARITVHWIRDSDKTGPDGVARLFNGDRLEAESINLDNNGQKIAKARLGLPAGSAGVDGAGSFLLDELWISP